jgi:tetratricopeptide (TPR) repeat protein
VRFGQSTLQATVTVCVALVITFTLTAFASSAYHRQREALGTEHYDRGCALEQRGELDAALEEYRKALLFAPNKTEYRVSLATALLEAGRLGEAQAHLEALLQEDPTSGPINLLVARLAAKEHNLKRAVEYYQRGVYQYWPENQLAQRREARWDLANLLNKTGDRNGFIGELMQLYTNLPAGYTADKLKVAFLLLANGATSEASRIFQEQVRQSPQNARARLGLGEVHFANGEYISARHEFQRVLRLDPKDLEGTQMLSLTNDVIDMDPALPHITLSEQLRRSRNLLSRVIKDLTSCAGNATESQSRLQDAQKLLNTPKPAEDATVALQAAAAQLWSERVNMCGKSVPADRALDTVLTKIGHE